MPSVRVDSSPLIAGACVVSAYPGLGVRGADVPSTGLHGASLLYPGLNLPAENDDEFIGLILTVPAGLTLLQIDENGAIQAEGPNGTYSGTYQGFKNGVSYGTNTYSLQIGVGAATGDAQLGDVAAGGVAGGGSPSGVSGGAQLDDVAAGGGASANSGTATGGAALGDVAAGGGGTSLPAGSASGNADLDDVQASGGGASNAPSGASGGATLDDVQASGGGSITAPPGGVASGDAQLDSGAASGGVSSVAITQSLDVFMDAVLPYVPGCPDQTVIFHARKTCIDWFQRTLTWREKLPEITAEAGVSSYALQFPAEASLAKILNYWIDGQEGGVKDGDYGQQLRTNNSSGDAAWTVDRVSLQVHPVPAGGEKLVVEVALKPTQASLTILDRLWEHYAEHLQHGTLARIYAMPKQPWTNRAEAKDCHDKYEAAVKRISDSASRGFARSNRRSKPLNF